MPLGAIQPGRGGGGGGAKPAWVLACAACACGWVVAVAGTAAAQDAPPASGFRPRIVREGTLSLGVQGQYGTFLARTGFGREFDGGAGVAVRVRYRTGEESALGASFESQRYKAAKDPIADSDATRLQGTTTTVEYYQFFDVRRRAPRYVLLGAGLFQTSRKLADGETDFPGDGGVVTLGGGSEVWWKRTVTLDVSLRYYGVIKGDNGSPRISHAVQIGAGLHFYTSR